MITKGFSKDTTASGVAIILVVLTIIVCGAYYTLFFLEIGIPEFFDYIPASDSKTLIMMGIGAIPVIILLIGVLVLLKSGQKRNIGGYI